MVVKVKETVRGVVLGAFGIEPCPIYMPYVSRYNDFTPTFRGWSSSDSVKAVLRRPADVEAGW